MTEFGESLVEQMARILYTEGAWCGDCAYEGWDRCGACRHTCRGYARALERAGFGMVK